MTPRLRFVLFWAAIALLSSDRLAGAQPIELKLAYFVGDQHAMSQWLIRWANNLEKDSGGRIMVKRGLANGPGAATL
jgi:TRAP-type C4-dicarboxylate transport system substrate-binding protein